MKYSCTLDNKLFVNQSIEPYLWLIPLYKLWLSLIEGQQGASRRVIHPFTIKLESLMTDLLLFYSFIMGDGYDMAQTLDYDDFFDDIDGASDEPGKFCADCDKAFFTNGLLEIHRQKVHDDASLLACSTCNVDFKRKMGMIPS